MLHAVVMAGGSGTRFWPRSRRNRPKQFLTLFGDRSMLQATYDRIMPLVPPERVLVITGEDQAATVREQLPDVPPGNVIGEPCPRDTAPCVGLAATIVARKDPDGTMIVMPADHVIEPAEIFHQTVAVAVGQVDQDPTVFVIFGVKPTRPEAGYGYIQQEDEPLGTPDGIKLFRVKKFEEKPDKPTAEAYLADGHYAWNAGIFVWRARSVLDALRQFCPEIADRLGRIGAALGTPDEATTVAHEFPGMIRIPIDKAVMEHYSNVRVLEVVYHWSDVGDWRSLAELLPADDRGNVPQGMVHPAIVHVENELQSGPIGTSSSIIISDDGGLIATLGVENLVIVQSGKATLVARKDQLNHLKALVEGLGEAGFGAYL